MTLSRRSFIVRSFGCIAASAALPACTSVSNRSGTLLSAFEDARGDQYVGGLTLDNGSVFGARVPMRAHGCALHPRDADRALFFARRPGTQAFELSLSTRRVRTAFTTPAGRHLSGHGVFSEDGTLLFTPEHDYANERGVIAVRDTRDFRIRHEIDTRGIDPHEIAWLPGSGALLVANGGILTHPRTFRRKLNISTMDPSLCVIDAASGACKEQWRLADHLLSIRHLCVAGDGAAAVGLQYEGDKASAPSTVAYYRPGAGLQLLGIPAHLNATLGGYVASVAITKNLIAASCPFGRGIACWSRPAGKFAGIIQAQEAYGLSRLADGSLYASQRDGMAFEIDKVRLKSQFVNVTSSSPIRWDDHWVAAA